jgi:DSF synthase
MTKLFSLDYDKTNGVLWGCFHQHNVVPCFSEALLDEIEEAEASCPYIDSARYYVSYSQSPVYSLGGDLGLFLDAIESDDRGMLRSYAMQCVDVVNGRANGYHKPTMERPLTTIALLQGDTLGGGLEAALSSDYIIAERGIALGFPESVFGLFPGMGASHLLARRNVPERMIRVPSIPLEDALRVGIIDELVEQGQGTSAVTRFIDDPPPGMRRIYPPVDRYDMIAVADDWVDQAFALPKADLKMMRAINKRQRQKYIKETRT